MNSPRKKSRRSVPELPESTTPLWIATSDATNFPALHGEKDFDVAIVGAGITGITAAVLLTRAGKRVALIEKNRIVTGETGHTTAHITEVTDTGAREIVRSIGSERARLVYAATREALERISRFVEEERIACHFGRVPAYFYSERESDVESLQQEAEASRQVGLDCTFTREVPLPFAKAGILYRDQAQFHPREYLLALTRTLPAASVFEQTHVENAQDGEPCVVETSQGKIRAAAVIVATNVPINNRVLLHTKLAAYRTYAIASKVEASAATDGLFWDSDDPYHYIRAQTTRAGTFLIIGGEDHKTGQQADTEECFRKLAEYAKSRFQVRKIAYRWSGQIIEPVDGLPYIGRNSLSKNLYVATGYSGEGMTGGTLAAMILSDLILGRENRYAEIFDPTRIKIRGAAKDYVSENVDFPAHLASDRLTSRDVEARSIEAVLPGEGAILELNGRKVALHKTAGGEIHQLSTICTHLGCDVRWNSAEKSWDCPCHGSRFSPTGAVINGPAVSPLKKIE